MDADKAKRYCSTLNNDPEFRLLARDITLNLAIEVGSDRRLLRFRDGELKAIGPMVPMADPVDVYIKGGSDFWNKLLSQVPPPRYHNLHSAAHAGTCEIAGNVELYNAYYPALNRMIDVMRNMQGAV